LPTKSGFKGFSSLFTLNKGLADLAEEMETIEGSDYGDDGTSFDVVDWEDTVQTFRQLPVFIMIGMTKMAQWNMKQFLLSGVEPFCDLASIIRSLRFNHILRFTLCCRNRCRNNRKQGIRNGVPNPSILSRTPSTVSNPYFADYLAGPTRLSGFHSTARKHLFLASPFVAPIFIISS
jgi:hypothetical protein